MFIIYDLIFLLIASIYLPLYLFRRKLHAGLLARLGFLPKGPALNKPVWIHAVSVGEAMAARGILEELRRVFPDRNFVITTVTQTGNRIARGLAGKRDFVTYLPFDISFIVNGFIGRIRPSLFIALETEIWPNLIRGLYKQGIPAIIINGRISDKSFKGYLFVKFLLRSIFHKINLFCVQTQTDSQRLEMLGVRKDKIKITGNMKFDISLPPDRDYTGYRLKLGLRDEDKLFVAGSTHSGEEEIILRIYNGLLNEFSGLRLLIAPRHPERSGEAANLIKGLGFGAERLSLLEKGIRESEDPRRVFILDTVGELLNFYAIADIVFVGGSLVKKGGHNILEPAALGKAVIFGPYMHNFRDIARLFLENKAAILANSPEGLKNNIRYLLQNPAKISELSQAAKKIILDNQGATRKNLQYILEFINQ